MFAGATGRKMADEKGWGEEEEPLSDMWRIR